MLKGFNRHLTLEKILQGLLYGLSAGLLAAGIAIFSFLLADLTDWYFYLIGGGIGLVALAVTFIIYYFTHRVKENEVAKRVDQAFNLHEKTATMVAYQGQESLLINKQREDAVKNLKGKKPNKLGMKLTLLSIPLPLIGGSIFTTSFFTTDIVSALTTNQEEENYDDITDDIIDSIKDYIGKSQASAAFKERLYEILEQLRADLKGDTSIPSRRKKIDAAKLLVDEALDEVNTKEEIGGKLAESGSVFAAVGEAVKNADVEAMKAAFDELSKQIDAIVSINGLLDTFESWIDALEQALKESGVSSGDANYVTFSELMAKLQAICDNVEDKVAASQNASSSLITQLIRDSREQAKKAIEAAVENLSSDLVLEAANDKLAEDVKKLMDQLIDPSTDNSGSEGNNGETEEGGNQNPDGEEGDVGDNGDQETEAGEGEEGGAEGGEGNGDGDKGEGNGSGSGGQPGEGNGQGQGEGASGGGGETEYGSDDDVYTGDHGQTDYGEVIGDYQNDASDDAKGTGDDGLEGAIGDYFDELYGNAGGDGN